MKAKITIEDEDYIVSFDILPEEKPTQYCPGCPAIVCIEDIQYENRGPLNNVEYANLMNKHERFIELQCFEWADNQIDSYRQDKIDREIEERKLFRNQ